MATTNSSLAVAALDAMKSAGITFALLHGAERLSEERFSDVDLVTDRDPDSVIVASRAEWRGRGLRPVVSSRYDLGGTAVWLTTRDASDGVQLDLMFDPEGRGAYGLRSHELLETAAHDDPFKNVSTEASLIYLWRKRSIKGQEERLPELRASSVTDDREGFLDLSDALTGSPRTAREILGELSPGSPRRPFHPARELGRLVGRIRRPAGFWAHAFSREVAIDLSSRFGRFLVSTNSTETSPASLEPIWWLREVLPYRLRPAMVTTWGSVPGLVSPDTVLDAQRPDEAAIELTSVMAARFG
ncbi:MAG: hypothetical protein ACLFWH_09875 [Actinomycetota bacterium]